MAEKKIPTNDPELLAAVRLATTPSTKRSVEEILADRGYCLNKRTFPVLEYVVRERVKKSREICNQRLEEIRKQSFLVWAFGMMLFAPEVVRATVFEWKVEYSLLTTRLSLRD